MFRGQIYIFGMNMQRKILKIFRNVLPCVPFGRFNRSGRFGNRLLQQVGQRELLLLDEGFRKVGAYPLEQNDRFLRGRAVAYRDSEVGAFVAVVERYVGEVLLEGPDGGEGPRPGVGRVFREDADPPPLESKPLVLRLALPEGLRGRLLLVDGYRGGAE